MILFLKQYLFKKVVSVFPDECIILGDQFRVDVNFVVEFLLLAVQSHEIPHTFLPFLQTHEHCEKYEHQSI